MQCCSVLCIQRAWLVQNWLAWVSVSIGEWRGRICCRHRRNTWSLWGAYVGMLVGIVVDYDVLYVGWYSGRLWCTIIMMMLWMMHSYLALNYWSDLCVMSHRLLYVLCEWYKISVSLMLTPQWPAAGKQHTAVYVYGCVCVCVSLSVCLCMCLCVCGMLEMSGEWTRCTLCPTQWRPTGSTRHCLCACVSVCLCLCVCVCVCVVC